MEVLQPWDAEDELLEVLAASFGSLAAGRGRPLDLVLWGCGGSVGTSVAKRIALAARGRPGFSWALVAHSPEELVSAWTSLQEACPHAEPLLLVASPRDQLSVDSVVRQTRVVLATGGTGPGEERSTAAAVSACVRFGTDFVGELADASWARQLARRYHSAAKERGVLILALTPSSLSELLAKREVREHHRAWPQPWHVEPVSAPRMQPAEAIHFIDSFHPAEIMVDVPPQRPGKLVAEWAASVEGAPATAEQVKSGYNASRLVSSMAQGQAEAEASDAAMPERHLAAQVLAEGGLCLLLQRHELRRQGGVLEPLAAGGAPLLARIQRASRGLANPASGTRLTRSRL
mmetsp:Transcript_52637/g.118579  ORF Transcript_52637/g.118579 Transcript_52637/m.118579 type:complete len:347 (+) Transcript_52637:53-1093(+)